MACRSYLIVARVRLIESNRAQSATLIAINVVENSGYEETFQGNGPRRCDLPDDRGHFLPTDAAIERLIFADVHDSGDIFDFSAPVAFRLTVLRHEKGLSVAREAETVLNGLYVEYL